MRVLVTGASGFIGSHIAEQLSADGHEVVALVRKTSKRDVLEKLKGIRFAEGTIEDRGSIERALDGVEAVIHGAALVKARNVDEFRSCNVGGTENVVEAIKAKAPGLKRFVFISSQAATAPSSDGRPVSNDVEPKPVTAYGWSKLEAEKLVKASAGEIATTIIRPPMVYGPRDNETFDLFESANKRVLPSIGAPEGKLSLIYGPDCARACILALTAGVPSGSAYFVTDGHIYTRKQLGEGLERAVGKKALVSFPLPTWVVRAAALGAETYGAISNKAVMLTQQKVDELVQQWVCDGSDAERELGFQPKLDWFEGAAVTARWYRENGWL